MSPVQRYLAFVGSQTFSIPQKHRVQICPRSRPRRRRYFQPCACAKTDGAADEPAKIENPVMPDASAITDQLDTSALADFSDEGLQAALSTSWDMLDTLDPLVGYSIPKPKKKAVSDDSSEAPITTNAEDADSVNNSSTAVDSKTKEGKPKTKRGRKPTKKNVKEPTIPLLELNEQETWNPDSRWYFLQVKPGCEQSCAISIRNLANSLESDKIVEVLVPITTIMRLTKSGKSMKKEERFFPSYILVLMAMSRQTYSQILNVPNVQYFMSDPNRDKKKNAPMRSPLPVSDEEMRKIFEKIKASESTKPEIKTEVRPGDSVEVVSGSFEGHMGRVLEVKPDLNIIKASLIVFGRETSVELEFTQIKVVDDIMNIREDDPEQSNDDSSEKRKKQKKKTRPLSDGVKNVAYASASDELAALLRNDPKDDWDPLKDVPQGDEPQDSNFVEKEEAGFGEATIMDDGEEATTSSAVESSYGDTQFGGYDDGFGTAEIMSDEETKTRTAPLRKEKKSKTSKFEADLAALLRDDTPGTSSDAKERTGLEGLDDFIASLEEIETKLEKENNMDRSKSDEEEGENEETEETTSEDELAQLLADEKDPKFKDMLADEQDEWFDVEKMMKNTPMPEQDEDDKLGLGGVAILDEINRRVGEMERGERPTGPNISDEDLMKPFIITDEEMPEYDFTLVPEVNPNDTSEYPAPPIQKKKKRTAKRKPTDENT